MDTPHPAPNPKQKVSLVRLLFTLMLIYVTISLFAETQWLLFIA